MKKIEYFLLRAISNLHAGSGEGDFSAVDKQVQRDVTTQLPTVYASSIKGALRELQASRSSEDDEAKNSDQVVVNAFGSSPTTSDDAQQGILRFFDAQLIAIPVRSSYDFFYFGTSPGLLRQLDGFLNTLLPKGADKLRKSFGIERLLNPNIELPGDDKVLYFRDEDYPQNTEKILFEEEWEGQYQDRVDDELKPIFGDRLVLLSDDKMKMLCENLPIIARNYLNDGMSENLWYEEVVPRETRFIVPVTGEDAVQPGEVLFPNGQSKFTFQLGANATVGYGLCTLSKIS